MKTLITHINPHLDDIFAIWLLKKYDPKFKDFEVDFISASHEMGDQETEDRVFVGTGGGKFDEHKEGLDTCAGSLVFDCLKEKDLLPKDELEVKALEELVAWNRLIDTGKAPIYEYSQFSVQSFIRSLDNTLQSSLKGVELGSEILDRILEVLKRKQQSIMDWDKRVEFQTKYGLGAGVMSETVDRAFCKTKQGDVFLMYDPKNSSVQFYSDAHDLESLYQKLKVKDADASWFLHQSHHMVICGSSSAPDFKKTKLSFEQLIEVAKSL